MSVFRWEVESVEGCETATPGERVTYTITGYNDIIEGRLRSSLKWGVKVDGVIESTLGSAGKDKEMKHFYMREEWEGKEIIVMAQNNFRDFKESAGQRTLVTASPRILPREVSGRDEARVGDTVEYKVTRYNREMSKISERAKRGMRWAVKVDGIQEILTGEVGETFNLEIRKEWDGKEIIVMAAVFSWEFDEGVSQPTRVGAVKAIEGFYYASDGTYLSKEGNSNKVYLANKYTKEGESFVYEETTDINITHDDFCYIAGIIYWEDRSAFEGAAAATQATFNAVKLIKGDNLLMKKQAEYAKKLLSTNYSTVSASRKRPLADSDQSREAKNCRRALIHVLTVGRDYSNGAILWDGIDFAVKGSKHNKATIDGGIEIQEVIWNEFIDAISDTELRNFFNTNRDEARKNISFYEEGTNIKRDPFISLGTGRFNRGLCLNKAVVVRGRQVYWAPNREHTNNRGYRWSSFFGNNLI
jgi:hypothetical protein